MSIQQLEPLWGTWHTTNVIGAGSYGIVYKAQHTLLSRTYTCAVKYISVPRDVGALYADIGELGTNDPEVLSGYYQQEIESVADEYDIQMQFSGNPNFVQVYDILSVPKQDMPGYDLLIRMELLNPLRGRFTDQMSPEQKEKEAISMGKDICRALQSMHACGYLHRDIKPQNILVSDAGVYKLADFGTAKKLSGAFSFLSMKGTMDYVAPEIMTGQKVGFSSDLYSLGLVLHYVLNRQRLPFASRLAGEPLPLPKDASPEMAQIILKACAYKPEDRYSDAVALYTALDHLATTHEYDNNPPENIKKLLIDAAKGDAQAQYNLGYAYEVGKEVEEDYSKAIKLYRKAAEQGLADAICRLGYCYQFGLGVDQDDEQAFKLYSEAAEQGNTNAICLLGDCYLYGEGVSEDDEQAAKLYSKAAELGNTDAMYSLGNCYLYGEGVSEDDEQAVKLYSKAAELGNTDAMYNLGNCYSEGWGVSKDYEQGVKLFRKAAEHGNSDATLKLGECYQLGIGVDQDMEQAINLYKEAAEHGNTDAIHTLGTCYENGWGVPYDMEQAIKLYREAAEQGNTDAMATLASHYLDGSGVPFDVEQAKKIYREAAALGNSRARDMLEFIESGRGIFLDINDL